MSGCLHSKASATVYISTFVAVVGATQMLRVMFISACIKTSTMQTFLAESPCDTGWCMLQEGNVFKGQYTVQAHGWQGPAYMLCSAQRTAPGGQPLSIKLFARGVDYLQEKALLEGPSPSLQEYLPGLLPPM